MAASLAWGLVCLFDTPWIEHGLIIDHLFFMRRNGEIDVNELLIHHKFDSTRGKQGEDVVASPQLSLLWFGSILMELCFGQRFSELRPPVESPLQLYPRISGLIDRVYDEGGSNYEDVVRRCIRSTPFSDPSDCEPLDAPWKIQ